MSRIRSIDAEVWQRLPPLAGWGYGAPRLSLREWWTYFMQGTDGGPIKIGKTGSLVQRLHVVNAGYPFAELTFVGIVRSDTALEGHLHRRFADLRIRGEWFRPETALIDHILALPEPS